MLALLLSCFRRESIPFGRPYGPVITKKLRLTMTYKKYCEDCRHFRPAMGHVGEGALSFGRCLVAPVSGDHFVARILDVGGYASIQRGADYLCGPEGKNFEPIDPVAPTDPVAP